MRKFLFLAFPVVLTACVSVEKHPDDADEHHTTVVVPANSGTTVVRQDGTQPPCH
jgi:hypothetical protein